MLGFVSLGSAYMLVSVGVTIYRRRNAVPPGEPIGRMASPAELQGCLEELSESSGRWSATSENFHNLLAHYDTGEAQRWYENESFWLGQWKAAGERCRYTEPRKGPLRQELGRAARDLRRAPEHRRDLHKGAAPFRTKPGPTPGPDARAT